MKKCPYCGTEYPDDATVCAIDTEVLVEHPPRPKIQEVQEQPQPTVEPAKNKPYLVYPDYQWSARGAWKCIGILVCLGIILPVINTVIFWAFPFFYRSGIGFACRYILFFATWIITASYFARTETLATFLQAFGLNRKPTNLVWFGVTMVLILRFVTHSMYMLHLGKGVYNYEIISFGNTIGPGKWLFQLPPLVLAPIFEECVNRGFLYKAFRRSYPVAVSMILMVAWTCYTHWSYYYESWIAALNLSAWTVLQCYLREKSGSLWDCVLCHFVSNAALLFMGGSS